MQCKICQNPVQKAFEATILERYLEPFYKCERCGFLSAGEVHWLSQAYTNANPYPNPNNASDPAIVPPTLPLNNPGSVIAGAHLGFSKSVIGGGGRGHA